MPFGISEHCFALCSISADEAIAATVSEMCLITINHWGIHSFCVSGSVGASHRDSSNFWSLIPSHFSMFLYHLHFGTCHGVWLFVAMSCSANVSVVYSGNETLVHRKGLRKTFHPFLHTHTHTSLLKKEMVLFYVLF